MNKVLLMLGVPLVSFLVSKHRVIHMVDYTLGEVEVPDLNNVFSSQWILALKVYCSYSYFLKYIFSRNYLKQHFWHVRLVSHLFSTQQKMGSDQYLISLGT